MWDSDFEDQEFHVPDSLAKTSGSVRDEGAAATELAAVLQKLRQELIQWKPDSENASKPETLSSSSEPQDSQPKQSVGQINEAQKLNESHEQTELATDSPQNLPEYIVTSVSLVHGSLQDDNDEFYSSPAWKQCNHAALQVSGESFSDVLATANDCLHQLQCSS